jgi:hypothetical protein
MTFAADNLGSLLSDASYLATASSIDSSFLSHFTATTSYTAPPTTATPTPTTSKNSNEKQKPDLTGMALWFPVLFAYAL